MHSISTKSMNNDTGVYHVMSFQRRLIIIIIIIIIRNLYSAIMLLGGYRGAGGTGR